MPIDRNNVVFAGLSLVCQCVVDVVFQILKMPCGKKRKEKQTVNKLAMWHLGQAAFHRKDKASRPRV